MSNPAFRWVVKGKSIKGARALVDRHGYTRAVMIPGDVVLDGVIVIGPLGCGERIREIAGKYSDAKAEMETILKNAGYLK